MWIADMDFRVPDCVVSAIEDYMKTGVFGYYVPRPSYHQAFIDWERKYHGYQVKEEWLRFAPGVVPAFNWFLQVFTEPACILPLYARREKQQPQARLLRPYKYRRHIHRRFCGL